MRWFGRLVVVGIGVVVVALSLIAGRGASAAASTVPTFDHIFIIVMENHSYSDIIGNTAEAPYINSLAAQYGVAANDYAVAHPSLPNYLALTGASTFGITSDCTTCYVNAANLAVDRVEAAGRTWKAYMESMPSPCYVGDAYPYVQRHDPFMYYNDVRLIATECAKVVPFTQLASDLAASATTPSWVWITPNVLDDMHDGTIAQGDAWLQQNVPTILGSAAFTSQKSLLLITWDEDDYSESNQIATLVIAPGVPAGFQSTSAYTHYSLVKTIEQAWGLATLTTNDANASPMTDFFSVSPTATPTSTSTPTSVPTHTPVADTPTNTPLPRTPEPTATAASLAYLPRLGVP